MKIFLHPNEMPLWIKAGAWHIQNQGVSPKATYWVLQMTSFFWITTHQFSVWMTLGKFLSLSSTSASSKLHPLDPLQLLQLHRSSSSEVEAELCSQVPRDRSGGTGLKLCQGKFSLDIRKKIFIKRAVKPLQRLHWAVVASPSLEGFKRYIYIYICVNIYACRHGLVVALAMLA